MQVAGGAGVCHKQGIQHRDIKPSNLLLDIQGTVWVTDFGLAKADDQENLTHTGDILGTLRYMPPEAFEGKTDARSDVYSLGLTLYEMLAFRPAFDEKERNRLIKQVTQEEPARLGKLNRHRCLVRCGSSRWSRSTRPSGGRGGLTGESGPTVPPPFSLQLMIPAMTRPNHNQGQLDNPPNNRDQPVPEMAHQKNRYQPVQ